MPDPTLPSLLTVTERPFNAESPLGALSADVTPTPLFFVRSNFDVPLLDAATWQLEVGGAVRTPQTLTLAELRTLPHHEVTTVVECAGNGRRRMEPVPPGTPWDLGAVSTGRFAGVPLGTVLERCGLASDVVEIVFEGADRGRVADGRTIQFARSLPLERALHPDTLLAWQMNGEPLTPEHGHPVRLLVPGWYGVASVKWLTRITAAREPFDGYFQTERYVYSGDPACPEGTPVTRMHVRALLTAPAGDVSAGVPVTLRGLAWSGFAAVRRVEWSADDGGSWQDARLDTASSRYAACAWTAEWTPPSAGTYELIVRAEDESGETQPLDPVRNELGYGNNVAQRVRIQVR